MEGKPTIETAQENIFQNQVELAQAFANALKEVSLSRGLESSEKTDAQDQPVSEMDLLSKSMTSSVNKRTAGLKIELQAKIPDMKTFCIQLSAVGKNELADILKREFSIE